jgi:hypothetical protein
MAMARDSGRRPWWKKKRWIAAGILLALAVCFETIPRFPFGPFRLYANLTAEQRAAKIPYDHLSDEATDPHFGGRPIIYNPPLVAAIRRWPHVRDCLVASERNAEAPDLRLIDWDLFADYDEAMVCLWRIFASLGTSERIGNWIAFHGYNVWGPHSFGTDSWSISGSRDWNWIVPMVPSRGILHWAYKFHPIMTNEVIATSWERGKIRTVTFHANN